eukprot:GSChrysophyteH1.ASY1.ANO1.745.1 assembled CDS
MSSFTEASSKNTLKTEAAFPRNDSEGASLGTQMESSVSITGDLKSEVSPEEGDGGVNKRSVSSDDKLLQSSTEEPSSKRRRNSRYVLVDGHAVLKENNYTIQDGFISVFDGDEIKTGQQGSTGVSNTEKSKGSFTINSFAKKKERAAKKANGPHKDTRDPVAVAHRLALKEDAEVAEVKRELFVNQHAASFKLFITPSYAKKIETLYEESMIQLQKPMIQFSVQNPPHCIDKKVVKMRDYQIDGVNFMLRQYHCGMSCVLADEMGLGKTLQTIAFLGTLKNSLRLKGPHLVVVPMSVLSNWMSEFKKFCPTLNVRMRQLITAGIPTGEVDCVVTTYEMVVSEGKNAGILSSRYRMLILDEAHKVKNDETQNNLKECWSLLNCMASDLVDAVFKLMKVLVLRRRKSDVNLNLPPKKELRLLCPMSKQQNFWYKRILLMNAQNLISAQKGAKKAKSSTAPPHSSANKLNNLMMQLRKISNHPYLIPGVEREDKLTTAGDLSNSSGKLKMLDRLLQTLRKEGHRCVIFSQFTKMLDLIEDFISMRGYTYVRLDGSTNRIQRMINIGRFNAPQSTLFLFLLSTRAGGLGVNLQTADTCILYDSDWNPQCDLQAMGRVHRIGQKRPVTIYRLVSAGTVEERIVARAARKLLLDEMVSKGSEDMLKLSAVSASASASKTSRKPENGEEEEDDEVQASEMIRALNYTADATAATAAPASLTDLYEDDEDNDEDDNMFSLSSADTKTSQFDGEDFSFSSLYKGKSLRDIRSEWEDRSTIVSGKRDNKSRLVEIDGGAGVGKVKILRENMYDLDSGEPTISSATERALALERSKQKEEEKKAAAAAKANLVATANASRRSRSGMTYTNLKHCQACGNSIPLAEMIQCANCPMNFHIQCVGFRNITEFRKTGYFVNGSYFCSHHKCHGCKKNTAEAGNLLLRCIGCPLAFCEDCADWDGQLNIVPEQPPHLLQKVGYTKCNQAVYCYCTSRCHLVSDETDMAVLGKNHPAVKAIELRKKQDEQLYGIKHHKIAAKSTEASKPKLLGPDGLPKLTKKQVKLEYKAAAEVAMQNDIIPTQYREEEIVKWYREFCAAKKALAVPQGSSSSGTNNAPTQNSQFPKNHFAIGEYVQAQWDQLWYHAQILRKNTNGTFAIHYPSTNGFLDFADPNKMRKVVYSNNENISAKWESNWLPATVENVNEDGTLKIIFTETQGLVENFPIKNCRKANLANTVPIES